MGSDRYGAIKRGEFVIIRGPSGGGKTTFLNILGTIDSSTHGLLSICFFIQESKERKLIQKVQMTN